ncbi:prolactin-releasing peptide [Lates japonicus]|uniref:Prolactin-releasing peptide n=1 Tax=Lates japonicus TaxID=270547 RepID=A0AAD3R1C5_LATJO|nr:prolactin-releasing peptide [Lates japonicus]
MIKSDNSPIGREGVVLVKSSFLHLLSSCGFYWEIVEKPVKFDSPAQPSYNFFFFPNSQAAMRVCAILCAVLLLLSQALSGSHREGSMIIRNPDIDASWYTGRGIRPVGRFGRKVAKRNEHLVFVTARVYRPTADSDSNVWITH